MNRRYITMTVRLHSVARLLFSYRERILLPSVSDGVNWRMHRKSKTTSVSCCPGCSRNPRVATPDGGEPQLETYADDAATVLAGEPPCHGGTTRLAEVARSEASFERERTALDRRVDRILPDNLLYRVETPHGAVGYPVPAGVPIGVRRVASGYGQVTIRV